MNSVTDDTFFGGRLTVRQPREGYRYSIDAVLLADFIRCKAGQTILDLGTGCGIIPLILAFRYPGLKIHGVEIQDKLARIAAENVCANNLTKRIHILNQDLKNLKMKQVPDQVQQVVCNPPYRRINSGRVNPHQEKAGARHEIFARLADFVDVAARMLQLSGSLTSIYPAPRLVDMVAHMRRANFEPKRLRMVHSKTSDPARLVLITGVKGGRPGGLEVEPPLVIYRADGDYTREVARKFLP
ncbi:MAG: tRNA1(Val) (adenine(37)-N6)-methyltransferase [Desulfobacterales bacterium]|nr:tRNA1(Val) (adenine(37)-N6)-methyltransferase [Desulfobacterales bacterium]